jgi:hypothetical protein
LLCLWARENTRWQNNAPATIYRARKKPEQKSKKLAEKIK